MSGAAWASAGAAPAGETTLRRRVLGACFIATTFEGYDLQSMGLAAPLLAKVMQLDKAQLGLALTATMLGLMIGATLGGWLGDRLGRHRVLAVGCALFGLGTLATAVAWGLGSLVLFRAPPAWELARRCPM
jgi:AAHS family 3-hydroxyphenylpropionic acid transporter